MIDAARGWQSSGIRVEPDTPYRIEARGRYQIARQPKPWWCEPGGVTIRYHRGQPAGMLLAAVSDDEKVLRGVTPLAKPAAIGLGKEIRFAAAGTLYFRINEPVSQLADNAGQLEVRVEPAR